MPSLSIKIKNVEVHLSGLCLLTVPEFTLNSGQKYLITGRSGCGKTLFLRLLRGHLATSSVGAEGLFTVIIDGEPVLVEKDYASYRKNQQVAECFSTVFQDAINSLHPYRSIADQMPKVLDIEREFENFNLAPDYFLNRQFPRFSKQCSGGECQRLSILSALLCSERDIFLLDEPLTDIDLISHRIIEADIREQLLCDEKRTVVLVTHNINWLSGINFQQFFIEDRKLGQVKARAALSKNDERVTWFGDRDRSDEPILRFSVHRQFRFQDNKNFVLFPFDQIEMSGGLALIGESGSGKSSLLRIIAGLMPYKFYGRDFDVEIKYGANAGFKPVQEFKRKERYGILQLVLQDTTMTLITEERIQKSLALICTQKGMSSNKEKKEAFEQKAREWMAHLDLSWDELVGDNKRIVDLSLGMMRRFSLLRAFLLLDIYSETDRKKPKLLLLDEIYRGLDAISLNLVISGLNKFCRDNYTNIIAVSHDVEFVSRICNRAIMIYKGQVLEEFDARLLSSKADRRKIYAKLEAPCYYERFFGDD
jgi:ABC-type glutathione transport system ATPase component